MNLGSAFVDNCDPLDDSVSCTGGGSPRWSIPINADRNGKVEGYAFIDAPTPDHRIGHAIPFVITDTPEPGTTLVIAIDVSK